MATATEEAVRKVVDAREALAPELDQLTAATRAAIDIPERVRHNPVRAAALAAGAGFLVVRGPRRVLSLAVNRIRPRKRGRYEGLLPKDVERVLKQRAGRDAPEVQDALEEDFAQFLSRKKGEKPPPTAAQSFLRTYDAMIGPLASRAAYELSERLRSPDPNAGPAAGTAGPDDAPAAPATTPEAGPSRTSGLLGRWGARRRTGQPEGDKPPS